MSYFDSLITDGNGVISISCPNVKHMDRVESQYSGADKVEGILQDDPQIQMGNTFTPMSELNDALKTAQQTQMVLGANNLLNYLPASSLAWQGTSPIILNTSFYLITISEYSNIQGQLKALARLAALKVQDDTSTRIHGGYRYMHYDKIDNQGNFLSNVGVDEEKSRPGTCKIVINHATILHGMLLTSLQFQPSTVSCPHGEPLYYIVNASFTLYRPAIITDLDDVFIRTPKTTESDESGNIGTNGDW